MNCHLIFSKKKRSQFKRQIIFLYQFHFMHCGLGHMNWAWFDFSPLIHGLKFKDLAQSSIFGPKKNKGKIVISTKGSCFFWGEHASAWFNTLGSHLTSSISKIFQIYILIMKSYIGEKTWFESIPCNYFILFYFLIVFIKYFKTYHIKLNRSFN